MEGPYTTDGSRFDIICSYGHLKIRHVYVFAALFLFTDEENVSSLCQVVQVSVCLLIEQRLAGSQFFAHASLCDGLASLFGSKRSVHCQWAFHLKECHSSTQTTYPSHRYPDGSLQTTRSSVKGRTTKVLTDSMMGWVGLTRVGFSLTQPEKRQEEEKRGE